MTFVAVFGRLWYTLGVMYQRALSRRAFTLIELLVVITIVAALIAILVPALSSVRSTGRLVVCVSNVRQQGIAIASYSSEFRERLPPKLLDLTEVASDGTVESRPWLINAFLSRWDNARFPASAYGWETPLGMWRCPEVRTDSDRDRFTHNGILHHAPNAWLFSSVVENRTTGALTVLNQAHAGWDQRFAQGEWRRVDTVRRSDHVVALLDNVSTWIAAHQHREAFESIESGCQVVRVDNECGDQKQGSHDRLLRRPAAFLDGHAAGLDSTTEYWFDEQSVYDPPEGSGGPMLWRRDVEHLVWYADPHGGQRDERRGSPRYPLEDHPLRDR